MESLRNSKPPVETERYSKAYQQQVDLKKRQLEQLIRQVNALEILKEQKMTQYQLLYEEIVRNKQKLRTVSTVQVEIDRLNFLLEMSKKSVALITPKELEEIMKYNNPPERIKLALEAVMFLLHGKKMDWDTIKREMSSGLFISRIIKFNPRHPNTNMINTLQRDYLKADWFDLTKIRAASQAVGPLAEWLVSQINYIKSLEKMHPVQKEFDDLKNERLELEQKELDLNEEITNIETMIDIAQIQRQNLEEEIKALEKGTEPENNLVTRISQYMQQARRDSRAVMNSRRSSFFPHFEQPIYEEDYSYDNDSDTENLTNQNDSTNDQRKRNFELQNMNVILHQKTSNPTEVAKVDKHVHFEGFDSQISDKSPSNKLIQADFQTKSENDIPFDQLGLEDGDIKKDAPTHYDDLEYKMRKRVDSASQKSKKFDTLDIDNNEHSTHSRPFRISAPEEFAEFDRKLLENSRALWDQDNPELFHPPEDIPLEPIEKFNTFNAHSMDDQGIDFNILEDHDIKAVEMSPLELNRSISKNMKKQSSKSELNIKLHHVDVNLDNTLSLTDISIRGDNQRDHAIKETKEMGVQVNSSQVLQEVDSFAQFDAQLQEKNGQMSSRARNRTGSEHLTQNTGFTNSIGISNLINVPKEMGSAINSNISSNIIKPAKHNDFHVSVVSFIDKMKSEPSIYSDPQELIQRIDDQIRRYSEHVNQEEQIKALHQLLEKNREEGLDVVPERNEENSLQQNESSTADRINRLNTFSKGSGNSIGLPTSKNQGLNATESILQSSKGESFQTFQREKFSKIDEIIQTEGLFSKKQIDKDTLTSCKFISVNQAYPKLTINPPINYLNHRPKNEGMQTSYIQNSLNNSFVKSEKEKPRPIQLDFTTHLTINHYHITEPRLSQLNASRIAWPSNHYQTLSSMKSINSSMNGMSQSMVQTNKRVYVSRPNQQLNQLPLLYHTKQNGSQLNYPKNFGMPIKQELQSHSYMPISIRSSYTRPSKALNEFPNQSEAVSPQQIFKNSFGTRSLSPLARSAQNSFASQYEPFNMSVTDGKAKQPTSTQSFKSFNNRPVSSEIRAAETRMTLAKGKEQQQQVLKTFNVNGRELYLIRIDDNVNIYRYKEDLDK